jgi:hypothetical protein
MIEFEADNWNNLRNGPLSAHNPLRNEPLLVCRFDPKFLYRNADRFLSIMSFNTPQLHFWS